MKDIIEKYKKTYESTLPKLTSMKKLWHSGYWDGPLSGVCEVDGQKCWFQCIEEWLDTHNWPENDDEFEPPWYRRYLIHKLTDDQYKEIEESHNKFRRMVGTHCDYDDNGERGYFHHTDIITSETVAQYYEEAKTSKIIDVTPVSEKHILGWYEW